MRLLLVFLWINLNLLAQENNYELKLKDYHSSQITQMVVTKDKQTLITADESGKIIAWNASDFSYVKTIKKPDGFFIEDMRLDSKDRGLLFKSKDTLWVFGRDGKVYSKQKFKGDILNKKNSDFTVLIDQNKQSLNFEAGVFNADFKPLNVFVVKNRAALPLINDIVSVNKQGEYLAYAVADFKNNQHLTYRDIPNNSIVWETVVEDEHKIAHLFFNKEGNKLYAITISEKEKIMSVYEYVDGQRKTTPEVTIPYTYSISGTIFSDYFIEDSKIIVSTKSGLKEEPILITTKNKKFSAERINLPNGAYTAVYLHLNKQLVSANVFQNNFNDIAAFSVYNFNKNTYINSYPNFSQEFYSGVYLPDDSWLVYGAKPGKNIKVKYYEKGTFYNRFQTLNFNDYLEINHQVKKRFQSFELYKDSGELLFYGYPKESSKGYFYKYSFENDIVTELFEVKDGFSEILDYNKATNKFLISPRKYFNRGHTEPQPLAIVKDGKVSKLEGNYKFAKFSNDGETFITINKDDLLQIRNDKQKVLFSQQLIAGSYKVHAVDISDFMISNSYNTIDFNKCNKETIAFLKQPDKTYKTRKQDCVVLNDIVYKGSNVAMIADGFGLIINNKPIQFPYSETPKSISLNKDGSKLMVNYANGKIGILDTKSLKELGGNIHPSDNEHIFYGSNSYFSNTDASNFLMVTNNKKEITLEEADRILFNPSKVLSVFSKPNQEYIELLNKAVALRKNKKKLNNIKVVQKRKNKEQQKSTTKGDLYVLSIGVSDYEQSNYNLTFADKDAFDIANLYGKLDDTTVQNFNTKFLGNKYTLTSSTGKNYGALKKYKEIYGSIGNLYPIDSQGNIWLEIDSNNKNQPNIWNYSAKKITPVKFPNDFKVSSFSFLNKQIYESTNNKDFFIKTDENFYRYSLKSNTFEKIKLPFQIDYEQELENLNPIVDDKWMYFKSESTGLDETIKLLFGKPTSNKIDSISINANYYKNLNGKIDEANIYNPYFKDISNNGKYVLYSASEKESYLINVGKDTIPTKLSIPITHLDKASISSDGKRITVLKTSVDSFRYKVTTYSIDGKVIDTSTLIDKDYLIKGLSILEANPKWITQSKSMVDRIDYSFKIDKELLNASPSSFKNVRINYLTNADATKKDVERSIESFFDKAKENDQIVLFIAGHGVLDKKNNYYYAPYNMDFNNVTKNGVGFKTIINGLSNSKATQKLLLMDTCHAGNTLDVEAGNTTTQPLEKDQRGGVITSTKNKVKFKLSNIISGLFNDFLSTSGVTVLSASSGGDVAYENKELGNGAFTTAYLKVLQDKIRGTSFGIDEKNLQQPITLDKNFIDKVLKEVIQLTNGKQIPDLREMNKNTEVKAW